MYVQKVSTLPGWSWENGSSSLLNTLFSPQHFLWCVGGWNPPTVADTKAKFYSKYKKPLPAVYNTVIQELLVQQHILRYNKNYSYDVVWSLPSTAPKFAELAPISTALIDLLPVRQIFALGLVSVFDQVLDGVSENAEAIFAAYIGALDEDPSSYRSDAEKLASWAKGLSGPTDIKPDAEGDEASLSTPDRPETSIS